MNNLRVPRAWIIRQRMEKPEERSRTGVPTSQAVDRAAAERHAWCHKGDGVEIMKFDMIWLARKHVANSKRTCWDRAQRLLRYEETARTGVKVS